MILVKMWELKGIERPFRLKLPSLGGPDPVGGVWKRGMVCRYTCHAVN